MMFMTEARRKACKTNILQTQHDTHTRTKEGKRRTLVLLSRQTMSS